MIHRKVSSYWGGEYMRNFSFSTPFYAYAYPEKIYFLLKPRDICTQ